MRPLFKIDTKGKVRVWAMEVADGGRYRTIAGLRDGKKVTSEWTQVTQKNVGKVNETSLHEQAVAEVEAQYTKKLDSGYSETLDAAQASKKFKPMLASKWEDVCDKILWGLQGVFIQPKLDGIRCIATKDGLFSRGGKPILGAPHVHEDLKSLFDANPDMILDGELYNHELKADFNAIVSMVKKQKPNAEDLAQSAKMVQYHVYDLPSVDANFSERYDALKAFGNLDIQSLAVVETIPVATEEDVNECYAACLEEGYEGGIIRLDGRYEQKRSKLLLKRKDFEDAEFTIVRIEEGLGNWSGAAKRVVFANDLDGREVGAGLAGTYEYAQQVLAEADQYIGKQVTVQFFTRTPDGVPRFPIAKVLHKEQRL